jgi:hypothetical protein
MLTTGGILSTCKGGQEAVEARGTFAFYGRRELAIYIRNTI